MKFAFDCTRRRLKLFASNIRLFKVEPDSYAHNKRPEVRKGRNRKLAKKRSQGKNKKLKKKEGSTQNARHMIAG